jgi:hypothetical protein
MKFGVANLHTALFRICEFSDKRSRGRAGFLYRLKFNHIYACVLKTYGIFKVMDDFSNTPLDTQFPILYFSLKKSQLNRLMPKRVDCDDWPPCVFRYGEGICELKWEKSVFVVASLYLGYQHTVAQSVEFQKTWTRVTWSISKWPKNWAPLWVFGSTVCLIIIVFMYKMIFLFIMHSLVRIAASVV